MRFLNLTLKKLLLLIELSAIPRFELLYTYFQYLIQSYTLATIISTIL
jgi:hypothetical protein